MITPCLLAFLSFAASQDPAGGQPEPAWGYDLLVWDMSANTTWIGEGHDYLEALFIPGGGLVTCAVVDNSPDTLKIFSSWDGGENWARSQMLTGSWKFVDPEIYAFADPDSCLMTLIATTDEGFLGVILCMVLSLPDMGVVTIAEIPWEQSGMDTLRSITAVWEESTGTHWVFADDDSDNLFYTSSSDGIVWSDPVLLASDASHPFAVAGPGGRIFLTYRDTSGLDSIMFITISSGGITSKTLLAGSPTSCPVVACETTGGQTVAVVVEHAAHVLFTMSLDLGVTWETPVQLGGGTYPFVDVCRGTTLSSIAFIDGATGLVASASAGSLEQLPGATAAVRSEITPDPGIPPVIRQGQGSSIQALAFMGEGPQDIWFDSALYTGIAEGEGPGVGTLLSAYPNPSAGSFWMEIHRGWGSQARVTLYSVDGRLIETVFDGVPEGGSVSFGRSLPAGVYLLRMENPGTSAFMRIVKL